MQDGDYGKQRLWSSIGWGACSLLAGWLITNFGVDAAFIAYGLLSAPLVVVGCYMRYNYSKHESPQAHMNGSVAATDAIPAAGQHDSKDHSIGSSSSSSIQAMLLKPDVMLFLWRCLLMGFGLGVIVTYEFLYLKQLGAPETLMGVALLVRHTCVRGPDTMQSRMHVLTLHHVPSWQGFAACQHQLIPSLCSLRLSNHIVVPVEYQTLKVQVNMQW